MKIIIKNIGKYKMKKIYFSVMLCMVLVFGKMVINAQTYNTNDSIRVRNFLIQSSANADKSNGEQLYIAFNADLPTTWGGFYWVEDTKTGEMRLDSIDIPNRNLAGNLNLKGCDSLKVVHCQGNFINSFSIDDIVILNCSNNVIELLDLSSAVKLKELYCNDNKLSFMDIHNSNTLQIFKAQNNDLSFATLIMPSKYAMLDKSGWQIGSQNDFKPDEVLKAGSNHYCEGGVIDFSTLRGLDYVWLAAPPFPPTILQVGSDYSASNNNIFEFSEDNMDRSRMVYCTITNPDTHYDLEMKTVSFIVLHYYNVNDVSKLRYFLEQPSLETGKKNGEKININYNADVPRSYGVTWKTFLNDYGKNEMRCISIDTFEYKELAGHLDVSNMTELEQIFITGNAIESIRFENNYSLWRVNCSQNELTELNIEEIPELLVLVCNDNFIEELDASNNKFIAYIDANNNALSEINLDNLSRLKELYCSNNKLTELNVSNLKNIERLHLDNNYVKELNLDVLTSLQRFSANNNLLTELNLSNCVNLLNISVTNNQLVKLDLTGLLLSDIERLDCSNNKLNFNTILLPVRSFNTFPVYLHPQDLIGKDNFNYHNNEYYTKNAFIDLSEYIYPGAQTSFQLYIIGTNGIEYPNGNAIFDGKFNISSIEGQKIIIKAVCAAFPNLTLTTPIITAKYEFDSNDVAKVRAFLNQYSKFGDENNELTNGKILNPNYDSVLPETFSVVWQSFNGVYRLFAVNWQNVSDLKGKLDLANCNKLSTINIACSDNLYRNDITSLNLSNCIELRLIFASYCQLETLSAINCSNLDYINCAHNKISSDVNLLNSKDITFIDFTDNKIENLLVSPLPNLTNLYVGFNKLPTLNITGNNTLMDLECNDNLLSELNIGNITTLIHLNSSNNKISEIDLGGNTELRLLYCNNNQLNSLVLDNCIKLSALTCANNKLDNLDLLGIPYLYQLDAENNALTFRTLQYKEIPNEISLHPQEIVRPVEIENHILRGDTLDLSKYFIEDDTIIANIILRYMSSGNIVDNNLYNLSNHIITNFHSTLADTSLYCEMTHSHYPGLVLKTIYFNTKKPWRYNEDEVTALRNFLNQQSKIEDITNGLYLSENYNSNDPETFPGVEWIPIDPEFRTARIKWNDRPDLQGNINFNCMQKLDTLQINGLISDKTGVDSVVIDNCISLKEIQLQNNHISKIKIEKCKKLEVVNLSNNDLTLLDLSGLDSIYRLDISKNALTFTSFNLTSKPESIQWWIQRELVPNNVTMITTEGDYNYELRDSVINLAEFGNDVTYSWYDENDNIISSIHYYGNGAFVIPKNLNNKVMYCLLTATDSLKLGLILKTVNFYVDFPVSILENLVANNSVYPNPTNNYVTIDIDEELASEKLNVNIINTAGNIVKTFLQTNYNSQLILNLTDLNNGAYFIQIFTDKKRILYPIVISK
jgi:Leucine-rich repeat (LRR) protein